MNLPQLESDMNSFGVVPRPYHKQRARWYHSAIIDFMISHPGCKNSEIALHVGKAEGTISAIVRSDLFQAALRHRQRQVSEMQNLIITDRVTKVAVASLDTILAVIEKKKDTLPLETLNEVADGALKRLGYGVEASKPAVQVNVQTNNNVVAPITLEELNAGRELMKQHQERIAASPSSSSPTAIGPGVASPSTGIEAFIEADFVEVKGAAPVNSSGEG